MEQAYLPATVRSRIQDVLKERKIPQAELAEQIGLSESAFSRFLSGKTDKIGDESILKIADYLGVSTDFILGQTDFPERRNYDIGELGLSYKAAMALYTRAVDTDVVNRLLENPQFPMITRMIARYFDNTFAEAFAGRDAMLEALQNFVAASDTSSMRNGQEGIEAVTQLLDTQKFSAQETDIDKIQVAMTDMLIEIKSDIQSKTPTSALATKEITETLLRQVTKGENRSTALPPVQLDQLSGMYAALTGATPEMGEQFSGLVKNFITGYMDIAQKQGLIPEDAHGNADE